MICKPPTICNLLNPALLNWGCIVGLPWLQLKPVFALKVENWSHSSKLPLKKCSQSQRYMRFIVCGIKHAKPKLWCFIFQQQQWIVWPEISPLTYWTVHKVWLFVQPFTGLKETSGLRKDGVRFSIMWENFDRRYALNFLYRATYSYVDHTVLKRVGGLSSKPDATYSNREPLS